LIHLKDCACESVFAILADVPFPGFSRLNLRMLLFAREHPIFPKRFADAPTPSNRAEGFAVIGPDIGTIRRRDPIGWFPFP
jgi:hypothetical protein